MALEWQLDNPAVALENYYKDLKTYNNNKTKCEELENELSSKQSKLNSQNSKLSGIQSKLSSMGVVYEQGNIEGDIQDVKDKAQRKIANETRKFEKQESDLCDKRDRDIQENDNWLKTRLLQLLGDDADVNRELTQTEKRALEFEIERRQFMTESNGRINGYEDAITEEQISCQTVVGELKSKQDAIRSKAEPDIEKFKKVIDSINNKYQPKVQDCQAALSEKVAKRDREIEQLQEEGNREIQLMNNEVEGYQKEFKKTQKQFNEQIRMAKLQKRPTTQMENSKVSRLNAINDQITKVQNRTQKKVDSINQKINVAQGKHAKYIEEAEERLNVVIKNRDEELSGPTKMYKDLICERDDQIAVFQSKIEERESECEAKVYRNKSEIESEKQSQSNNNSRIDQEIVEFVMSGDTCFSDVLDEQNAPFMSLQDRINTWMDLIHCILNDKVSSEYPKEHEKQKAMLASKEYNELQVELTEATQYSDKLSVFAKNNRILTIVGGLLTVLGIIWVAVLYAVLKISVGMVGFLVAIVGVALMVATILKTRKEFSLLCKYVSLAADYKEFPSIASHSAKLTQDKEQAKMKALGARLFDIYYGRKEAQDKHDAENADIISDYEQNLRLARKKFENAKAEIERERNKEINDIKTKASDSEKEFNNKKDELESDEKALKKEVNDLSLAIDDLKNKIKANSQFIDDFEDAYRRFEKMLDEQGWFTKKGYAHNKLNDSLYIVPDNKEKDDYNHRKIYLINHNKKPFVINYDIDDVEGGKVDDINKIICGLIMDLMYAVYHMNDKELYLQYVIDGNAATDILKNGDTKNAFNIVEVVGKLDDIKGRIKEFLLQKERLAEKGITIDELNEQNYNKGAIGDRPETYKILYIIFKPDERNGKLDDDIRTLSIGCEKCGFLPIFVCEKNTWEKEIQENASIYKDIKGLANEQILVYNGKTYANA
jgi:hypothetical protein